MKMKSFRTFVIYCIFLGILNKVLVVQSAFVSFKNTREIIITDAVKRIQLDGFPVEYHRVKTKDGYILALHRIPFIKKSEHNEDQIVRRPVVFLLAGIYASSDAWLLNGKENSLPYLLSREGFDVWLGNNRGNIYSKLNVYYNASDPQFWSFSWHEMSIYDMPAMIDYIRIHTTEQKIHFVGISQGGTIFLVLNSMLPQYNSAFKTATLLAPVAYVDSTKGSLAKIFGPLLGTRNYLSKLLEGVEMVSTNKYVKKLLSMACLENEKPIVCVSRLWPVVGYDTGLLNKTLIPDIMANFPVGGSFKQIIHYFQGYMSKKFRQYDHGPEQNYLNYRQMEPPEYNLKNVMVPTSIYYAENDYIVSVADIWKLVRRLRTVREIHKLPPKRWNHFDFICGLGVKTLIFDRIVNSISAYEWAFKSTHN